MKATYDPRFREERAQLGKALAPDAHAWLIDQIFNRRYFRTTPYYLERDPYSLDEWSPIDFHNPPDRKRKRIARMYTVVREIIQAENEEDESARPIEFWVHRADLKKKLVWSQKSGVGAMLDGEPLFRVDEELERILNELCDAGVLVKKKEVNNNYGRSVEGKKKKDAFYRLDSYIKGYGHPRSYFSECTPEEQRLYYYRIMARLSINLAKEPFEGKERDPQKIETELKRRFLEEWPDFEFKEGLGLLDY